MLSEIELRTVALLEQSMADQIDEEAVAAILSEMSHSDASLMVGTLAGIWPVSRGAIPKMPARSSPATARERTFCREESAS